MIPAPMITTSKEREDADVTASGRFIRADSEKDFPASNLEPNKLVFDSKARLPNCLLGAETTPLVQGLGFGRNVEAKAIFWVLVWSLAAVLKYQSENRCTKAAEKTQVGREERVYSSRKFHPGYLFLSFFVFLLFFLKSK
jgi:hypothetical protein